MIKQFITCILNLNINLIPWAELKHHKALLQPTNFQVSALILDTNGITLWIYFQITEAWH